MLNSLLTFSVCLLVFISLVVIVRRFGLLSSLSEAELKTISIFTSFYVLGSYFGGLIKIVGISPVTLMILSACYTWFLLLLLIRLVPKPGVVSMLMIIDYLLIGILIYGIDPIMLLTFVVPGALMLEIWFYFTGYGRSFLSAFGSSFVYLAFPIAFFWLVIVPNIYHFYYSAGFVVFWISVNALSYGLGAVLGFLGTNRLEKRLAEKREPVKAVDISESETKGERGNVLERVTWLHPIDAWAKIIFLVLFSFFIVPFESGWIQALFLAGSITLLFSLRPPWAKVKHLFLVLFPFILILVAFTQGLFYGQAKETAWFSLEGLIHGFIQSFRVLSIATVSLAVLLTTIPEQMVRGLRQLGLPKEFCEVAACSLHMVFPLLARVKRDFEPLKTQTQKRSFIQKVKIFLKTGESFLIKTIEKI